MPHHNRLAPLLHRLKTTLESDQCRVLVGQFVDRFQREITQRVIGTQWDTTQPAPLAKLIPVLTDGFARLCSTDFDSPVQDVLISNQLHMLCVAVFERC